MIRRYSRKFYIERRWPMGPPKDEQDWHDWTRPGEVRYDPTGMFLVKGWEPHAKVRAWIRRYILRRKPIFWMKEKLDANNPND